MVTGEPEYASQRHMVPPLGLRALLSQDGDPLAGIARSG